MSEYDLLIRSGTIVDGTGSPSFTGDVAVKGGKIAAMGRLSSASADKVLDAAGLIVAPGFIDLHTHYDAQVHWDPYCTGSSWHGVTSVVMGNCGFGFAPCKPKDQERLMLSMTRNEAVPLEAIQTGMKWTWTTFAEYLDSVNRIPKGINVATHMPLSPVYAWVMGFEAAKSRRPRPDELETMCRLVGEAIDAGAMGWTAQVFGPNSHQRDYDGSPVITDLMSQEEVLAFARVLHGREAFISFIFDTGRDGVGMGGEGWGLDFPARVAAEAGRPFLYQSLIANPDNPEQHRKRLRWLQACAAGGVPAYGLGATQENISILTFADWNLYDRSPGWRNITVGTPEERKAKMQDPAMRAAIRAEGPSGIAPGVENSSSIDRLLVDEVFNPELKRYEGKTIGEIAAAERKHLVDALLDLVVADDLQTDFIRTWRGSAEYTGEINRAPRVVAGASDGGAHVKFMSLTGYPTELLTWMVRDERLLTLEQAHYKLSNLPAQVCGMRDRGVLREGAAADIVVYELAKLASGPLQTSHDLPGGDWRRVRRAQGYRWIVVNGRITYDDGRSTGAFPGKLIRRGRVD